MKLYLNSFVSAILELSNINIKILFLFQRRQWFCFLIIFTVTHNNFVKSFLTDEEKSLLFGLRPNVAANSQPRKEKSLINTFPFNLDRGQPGVRDNHQTHHHDHHTSPRVSAPQQNSFVTFKTENNSGQVSIEDFIVENEGNEDDTGSTEVPNTLEEAETNEVNTEDKYERKCIDKVKSLLFSLCKSC